jgi:hypothetical protein
MKLTHLDKCWCDDDGCVTLVLTILHGPIVASNN